MTAFGTGELRRRLGRLEGEYFERLYERDWRRRLNDRLSNCDAVIALIDEAGDRGKSLEWILQGFPAEWRREMMEELRFPVPQEASEGGGSEA